MEIKGHLDTKDQVYLLNRAAKAKSILEIGCWHGLSTSLMASVCEGIIRSVDVFAGCVEGRYPGPQDYGKDTEAREAFLYNLARYISRGSVVLHDGVSWEVLKTFRWLGYRFDFAFIDGDHSYSGVYRDIMGTIPLMCDGGIISGHDIHWSGVRKAVDLLCPGWTPQGGYIWEWTYVRKSPSGSRRHDDLPSGTPNSG